jgi:hypothetical protein
VPIPLPVLFLLFSAKNLLNSVRTHLHLLATCLSQNLHYAHTAHIVFIWRSSNWPDCYESLQKHQTGYRNGSSKVQHLKRVWHVIFALNCIFFMSL